MKIINLETKKMAKKSYKHIPAVKQKDEMACWAACMKWWKKAVRSIQSTEVSSSTLTTMSV
jgi:hypothetical protein